MADDSPPAAGQSAPVAEPAVAEPAVAKLAQPAVAEPAGPAVAGPAVAEQSAPAIQTVQRAAVILNAFTAARPRLSLNELTASLGTSKATAHRYTKALRESNLLRYDEREGLYSLGPQILTLSAAARAAMPVISIAGPHMQQLVREVDETVVLSVWDGDTAVVVRADDNTDRVIRVSVRTGSRLSRTESAQGRVFCAFLPAEDVPGLADDLAASAELRHEVDKIRRTGISANTPSVNGVRSIAAPIFRGQTLIAAMAIVGTTTSVPEGTDSPLAAALQRAAAVVTAELGSVAGNGHHPGNGNGRTPGIGTGRGGRR